MKPIPTPPPTGFRKVPRQKYKVFSVRLSTHQRLMEVKEILREATGQKFPNWRIIQYALDVLVWVIEQNGGKVVLHRPREEGEGT